MINILSRRFMLGGIAAAGVITMHEKPLIAGKTHFFQRIKRPIGLQLYTLGDDVAKNVDATLARVAAIGFKDLQLPQLYGKTPAEMKAAADRAGVSFSCVHLGATPNTPSTALSIFSSPQRIADDLGAVGATGGVMPIMLFPTDFNVQAGEDFGTAIARSLKKAGSDIWKRTAALLNEKAAALKPHGITIGYHNHNMEFDPIGDTTGWEILAKETDASLVQFEVDVGWIAAGGLDPVAFLKKYKGRVRWLHMKDVQPSTKANYALKMDPTEVGSGKQDWVNILRAAHKAGCQHYYVEQEAPFAMARIDAAAKGYVFLKGLRG